MARLHFTKKGIEAIAPAARLQNFTDDQIRGLTLLVTPKGVKTFYFVRKFEGRVERTKLGRFPECTVHQARSAATQLHAQYDQGINPAETRRRKRRELSLAAFFEVYYRDHCEVRNRRPEVSRYVYERYVGPPLGHRRLSSISRADVIDLHRRLGAAGLKRTANKAHTLLRAVLNKAIAWEYLDGENPAQHIERFREYSRERFLLPEELARFHKALAEEPDALIRDFFLILLLTGVRKGEALCMRWRDVDLDHGIWRIQDAKNGEPRSVVLAGGTQAILQRRRDEAAAGAEWVFPGRSRNGPLHEVKRAWQRILDRAGIDDLWIHDLRRTHGSWMLARGVDLPTIGKALGHKDFSSTLTYARTNLDPVRKAVEETAASLMPRPASISKREK